MWCNVTVCAVSSRSPTDSSPAVSPRLSSSPRARTARSSSSQLLDVGWTSDRPVSGSRSLGTSPRPSTSSDIDPALTLPHTGQQELDHAMEISQLNLRGKYIAGYWWWDQHHCQNLFVTKLP